MISRTKRRRLWVLVTRTTLFLIVAGLFLFVGLPALLSHVGQIAQRESDSRYRRGGDGLLQARRSHQYFKWLRYFPGWLGISREGRSKVLFTVSYGLREQQKLRIPAGRVKARAVAFLLKTLPDAQPNHRYEAENYLFRAGFHRELSLLPKRIGWTKSRTQILRARLWRGVLKGVAEGLAGFEDSTLAAHPQQGLLNEVRVACLLGNYAPAKASLQVRLKAWTTPKSGRKRTKGVRARRFARLLMETECLFRAKEWGLVKQALAMMPRLSPWGRLITKYYAAQLLWHGGKKKEAETLLDLHEFWERQRRFRICLNGYEGWYQHIVATKLSWLVQLGDYEQLVEMLKDIKVSRPESWQRMSAGPRALRGIFRSRWRTDVKLWSSLLSKLQVDLRQGRIRGSARFRLRLFVEDIRFHLALASAAWGEPGALRWLRKMQDERVSKAFLGLFERLYGPRVWSRFDLQRWTGPILPKTKGASLGVLGQARQRPLPRLLREVVGMMNEPRTRLQREHLLRELPLRRQLDVGDLLFRFALRQKYAHRFSLPMREAWAKEWRRWRQIRATQPNLLLLFGQTL